MLRNKILYALLLAATYWVYLIYEWPYEAYLMWMLMLILPGLLAVSVVIEAIFGRVSISLSPSVVQTGEYMGIRVTMQNRMFVPIRRMEVKIGIQNMYTTKEEERTIVASIAPFSKETVYWEITPCYVGKIQVRVLKVTYFDSLKIWHVSKLFKCKGNFLEVGMAIPAKENIAIDIQDRAESDIEGETNQYSKVKPGSDPSEVFDIREYAEGDKLQRIHWKLSAKKEQLYVKEFSFPLDMNLVLLLDLSVPKGRERVVYMDTLLESLFCLSAALLEEHLNFHVEYISRSQQERKRFFVQSEEELDQVIQAILEEEKGMEEDMEYYLTKNRMNGRVFLFTGNMYEQIAQLIEQAEKVHLDTVIYVEDSKTAVSAGIIESCQNYGVNLHCIFESQGLSGLAV